MELAALDGCQVLPATESQTGVDGDNRGGPGPSTIEADLPTAHSGTGAGSSPGDASGPQTCRVDCQTSPPSRPRDVLDQEQFAGAALDFPAEGQTHQETRFIDRIFTEDIRVVAAIGDPDENDEQVEDLFRDDDEDGPAAQAAEKLTPQTDEPSVPIRSEKPKRHPGDPTKAKREAHNLTHASGAPCAAGPL